MIQLRRAFHEYPELAFEEKATATRIRAELKRLGIPCEYRGAGHGVVGRLSGGPDGPTVALRAEMDALPGKETTGLDFASRIPSTMHACGHDAHMAMVLGAAASLAADPPPGNVVFVFQPAEERGSGSRTVIADGALEDVEAIFAGHVTHEYETGQVMVASGTITAQSDGFTVRVTGKGGHGARPHEAIDAVVITGFLITAIQTLVSREVSPMHPSVVTIGRVEAGSAANVIAEEAVLEGTIRTFDETVRQHVHNGLRRMVSAVGELHDAEASIEFRAGNPPVVNTPREADLCRRVVEQVVGKNAVARMGYPSMGSEDFSYYLKEVPGAYVRIGARRRDWQPVPLHSPNFDVDEEALAVGAVFFDALVREALREYAGS